MKIKVGFNNTQFPAIHDGENGYYVDHDSLEIKLHLVYKGSHNFNEWIYDCNIHQIKILEVEVNELS